MSNRGWLSLPATLQAGIIEWMDGLTLVAWFNTSIRNRGWADALPACLSHLQRVHLRVDIWHAIATCHVIHRIVTTSPACLRHVHLDASGSAHAETMHSTCGTVVACLARVPMLETMVMSGLPGSIMNPLLLSLGARSLATLRVFRIRDVEPRHGPGGLEGLKSIQSIMDRQPNLTDLEWPRMARTICLTPASSLPLTHFSNLSRLAVCLEATDETLQSVTKACQTLQSLSLDMQSTQLVRWTIQGVNACWKQLACLTHLALPTTKSRGDGHPHIMLHWETTDPQRHVWNVRQEVVQDGHVIDTMTEFDSDQMERCCDAAWQAGFPQLGRVQMLACGPGRWTEEWKRQAQKAPDSIRCQHLDVAFPVVRSRFPRWMTTEGLTMQRAFGCNSMHISHPPKGQHLWWTNGVGVRSENVDAGVAAAFPCI